MTEAGTQTKTNTKTVTGRCNQKTKKKKENRMKTLGMRLYFVVCVCLFFIIFTIITDTCFVLLQKLFMNWKIKFLTLASKCACVCECV